MTTYSASTATKSHSVVAMASTKASTVRPAASARPVVIETSPAAIGRRHFVGWSRSASMSNRSLTT